MSLLIYFLFNIYDQFRSGKPTAFLTSKMLRSKEISCSTDVPEKAELQTYSPGECVEEVGKISIDMTYFINSINYANFTDSSHLG